MSLYGRMGDEYMGTESSRGSGRDREWMDRAIAKITVEAARREAALRKKMGEPKFKVGDKVWFKADGAIASSNEWFADEFK